MKIRSGFVSNSSTSSFVLGLKTVGEQDVLDLLGEKTIYTKTCVHQESVLTHEIAVNVEWAQRENDAAYLKKMMAALEMVKTWYEQYPKVMEIEISYWDQPTMHKVFEWEENKKLDILWLEDANGNEERIKIFD